MEATTVTLSRATPRDLNTLPKRAQIGRGLAVPFGMAAFFDLALLGLVVLVLSVQPDAWPQVVVSVVFFSLFSTLVFFLPAWRRLKRRQQAFQNGLLLNGQVVGTGRVFVPWKSWRDYMIEIEVALPDGNKKRGRLRTAKRELAESIQVGQSVQALFDQANGALFFPLELNLRVELQ